MKRWIVVFVLAFSTGIAAGADVFYKRVEYKCDGNSCVGLFYSDRTVTGRRPAVLLCDEAGSTKPATREHAAQIARLGYVVFTADLYGDRDGIHDPKGARPPEVVAALNQPDHRLMRARADAALKTLLKQSGVEWKQIAAVGYGIGGTAMIELSRTGVDLECVVCVHGPVTAPLSDDTEKILPAFLVLAGADDPAAPAAQLKTFEKEMDAAKIECSISRFPGEGPAFSDAAERKAEAAITLYLAAKVPLKVEATRAANADITLPKGVPDRVAKVLKYVDEYGEAMEGYEGGRTFGNYEHRLPGNDDSGKRVRYREWDVNPHRPGVNRGVERLITGSDGTAWYTDDHYETFKQIR